MNLIEITDLSHPGLKPFASLTTPKHGSGEVVVAESPKVIERALDAGLVPMSLLCESRHIEGDAAPIIKRIGDAPVFTGSRELLSSLTGYTLTRGVLCALKYPDLPAPEELLQSARRVCVIHDVCEATNIGVIFRTAAALGYDAVLVSNGSCTPFSRRAVRVSMGAVFQIPWTFCGDIIERLEENKFESISMALTDRSVYLQDFQVNGNAKYSVILGSEGYGLPQEIIDKSTHTVKIPMHHGVDSLNVGSAAAIALWHFSHTP